MTGAPHRLAQWLEDFAARQRLLSRPVQYLLDGLVLTATFALVFWARFEFTTDFSALRSGPALIPAVVAVQLVALAGCGVHAFIWRYVGLAEVRAFVQAALLSGVVLIAMRLFLPTSLWMLRAPLSVIVIHSALGFSAVLGLRVLRRSLWERSRSQARAARHSNGAQEKALLVGAGQAGVLVMKEILGRGDLELAVEGFVDDDPVKAGAVIQGRRVLGTTADLPRLVTELGIRRVIITVANLARPDLRRIVEICERIPVKVQIIPGLYEILGGQVEVSRFRDVEIEDLLGREPVQLDETVVRQMIAGRAVMVTGAGGSIGSEMCRQLARFGPGSLLLVERAESALFDIHRELRESHPALVVAPLVADVGEAERMRAIMASYRPEVVFHAAAHKHVPLMETNPGEAVKNNVLATRTLGELAAEHGVDVFVMISTDKAVRPTSVMGASKRLAELVVQDLDARYDTRFVAVRFGNVMGSAGSVIPIFREQIRRGGPVTVTHPDMVRYFMTIPEASQLVMQAAAMGEGGEIFVLDMGEPVRILDMATSMIRLYGLKPDEDVDIVFTGLRPGEKLFEELEFDGEHMERTRHPKIYIGKLGGYPPERVAAGLERLRVLTGADGQHGLTGADGQRGTEGIDGQRELRRALAELLPEARMEGVVRGESL